MARAMDDPANARTLVETLPLAQRLALTYAPGRSRGATLALLALDERMARIVRGGGEPIVAQIKLAWWRDRLGEKSCNWPAGEPLLALLRHWPGEVARLGALVDGWEHLLAADPDDQALQAHARGRAEGWADLAEAIGDQGLAGGAALAQAAGAHFALSELALGLIAPGHLAPAERERVRQAARGMVAPGRTPDALRGRAMRPLAVLQALAARALRRDLGALLGDRGAVLVAFRVGIAGR